MRDHMTRWRAKLLNIKTCHLLVTSVAGETHLGLRRKPSHFKSTVRILLWFWFYSTFSWIVTRNESVEYISNKRDTDLSKLSIADDGPVTQHHQEDVELEEEIIFSNPQNNHPTLEIIQIEIPKVPEHTRKHKYSDSSSSIEDLKFKVCILIILKNLSHTVCHLHVD